MATQTLKTSTKVTIKATQQKGVIVKVERGRYFLEGLKIPYFAHEIKATPITPTKSKATRINEFSPQRQKLDAIYSILRREWMPHNKTCVAHFAGCTQKATEVHHMYKRTGFWLIIVKLWMPLCRSCHRYATKNSRAAIDAGVSVSRLQDIPYSFTKHELNLMKLHNVSPPV